MEEHNNKGTEQIVRENMITYANTNISNQDDKMKAETEINILVDALINGQISPSELGGINAMRGFFYQYYVAIYYLIKDIYIDNKFKYLVYELGDDVTLISDNVVKFIQVKTEKEDKKLHAIDRGTLTTRDKKLDSWVDKLFLNIKKISEKLDGLGYSKEKIDKVFEEFDIEFELCTNMAYNSKVGLAQYSDKDIIDKEHTYLSDNLSKEFKGFSFATECPKDLKWCLDRFTIEHMGVTDILWRTIVTEIQSARISDDLEIANRMINKLLIYIILQTHCDNIVDPTVRKKYIFKKEIVAELLVYFKNQAINELNNERKNLNFQGVFDRYFQEISEQIDSNWKGKMHELFTDSLLWLQNLISDAWEKDPYIYQRLINRMFFLEGYGTTVFDINSLLKEEYLKSTIRTIIFYMAFYSHRSIYDDYNTKFFIKEGITEYNEKNIITVYNARNIDPIDVCIEKVIRKSKKCSVVSSITGEINCFLLNDKKVQIKENALSKILVNKTNISRSQSVPKIKDKYDNIRFFDSSNLDECRRTLEGFSDQTVAIDIETTKAVLGLIFNNRKCDLDDN